jgi:3',5'-cyclic AMP phosphodiesterase CpdA
VRLLLGALLAAFVAQPAFAADPVVLSAADIASCDLDSDGDEQTADLLDDLAGTILVPGDLAYDDGTLDEFEECYDPTWGRHKARTYPAPGNHEYNTDGAEGYYDYFGAVAGDPDEGWYSFDLGEWHIISLNSNCDDVGGCERDSKQGEWLAQDLASNPAACTLAFWHHPRFNSGDHHGSREEMADFWAILDEADADVVLAGHEHLYERFGLQDAEGDADPEGVRQFTVGMGGRSHYQFDTPLPNSEKRNDDTWGVLKLTLRPAGYDWEFVGVSGSDFEDTGSADCVGAAGPPPPEECSAKNGGDVDADGVCGDGDNCPSDANAAQDDGDGDGWGDACDPGAGGGLDALVEAADDDAAESGSGKVKLAGKSLKLGKGVAAVRFPAAGIPAGATIASAFLEFEREKPYTKGGALVVRGQESGAAGPFVAEALDVSSRAQTSASVAWDLPASEGEKGRQVVRSPNLAPVLEELAAGPGWGAGSAVVLVLSGEGALSVPAFEGEPSTPARLHIVLAP